MAEEIVARVTEHQLQAILAYTHDLQESTPPQAVWSMGGHDARILAKVLAISLLRSQQATNRAICTSN